MSEKRESDVQEGGEGEEQEGGGGEEGGSDTHLQPGASTEEQPPEDDGEPGGGGEEEQEEQEDRSSTVLGGTDVLETAEEAETRAELQDDIEPLGQPQKTEAGNSTEDVLETAEEAETQADLPDDAESLTEPQRKENVGNSTATVKVVLVPEGHVMTVAFAIGLSIQELKRHLAAELRVPADVLQISVDGRAVEEQQSLMELGVRPHGSTRMEMSSTDPNAHPLRPLRPPEHDNMPDVITVRVQADEGVFQEVVVEFHHATSQTPRKSCPEKALEVFSRDTQTVEVKSQTQQCPVDASTQMTGIGCYVSCLNDKLVAPGNYTTADEHHDRRLRAVIRLQALTRRWLAQQEVDRVRRERDRRLAWLEMQERRRREEKEEQLRDRRQRWMNPQRREDFNLLYHALEKWRCDEEQRINSSLRGAERKAALCSLLEQEAQLIADIGRHQITVQHNNYDKTVRNFLDKSAAPHQWRAANGQLIEMDSLHIIRARELRDLYSSMATPTESRQQRLQVLMTLKHTVKEHACALTRDIVDLIDREVDLMTRGVKAARLEGLRKRISTLFLQYIKIPAFNPEVAKLLKVPQNPSQLMKDMFLCRSCQRYLRSANFTPSASNVLSSQCTDCTVLNNIAKSRNDYSCYQHILKRLRADELQLDKGAKIPFLLQVEDVQYLLEVIWASRSVLNGSSDLYNLVFVRWDRRRDWSPWNCLLLSNEETSAHMELEDVSKVLHVLPELQSEDRGEHLQQVVAAACSTQTSGCCVLTSSFQLQCL
uniref:IQ motif and ubiquitin domain containing n=1 Tax=Sparus aurata TaxID=8175 RepID=A0A671UH66_SPAAU